MLSPAISDQLIALATAPAKPRTRAIVRPATGVARTPAWRGWRPDAVAVRELSPARGARECQQRGCSDGCVTRGALVKESIFSYQQLQAWEPPRDRLSPERNLAEPQDDCTPADSGLDESAPPLLMCRFGSHVIVQRGLHYRVGYLSVGGGRLRCCGSRRRASQNRSGRAEREDRGNDDRSPDAHDSSMRLQRSAPVSCPLSGFARRTRVVWSYCRSPAFSYTRVAIIWAFSK